MPDLNQNPYSGTQNITSPKPENYLVWAILATLCCCVPTGIAAIVYAAQVDSKWAAGDQFGAREASENAKLWSLISLGVGLVFGGIWFVLNLLGAASS